MLDAGRRPGGPASSARDLAREMTALGLRLSGLPTLVRRIATRRRAAVLVYHDPKPEVLDAHLRYLQARYHFITLGELVDAIYAHDFRALPPRPLVITIDDGHRGNRALGAVFQKYGCRPTVYVCSEIVGTNRRFWFHTGSFRHLKGVAQEERLRALESQVGFAPTREYEGEPAALTKEDLAEMRGWADIESHTRFHPVLTTCLDQECAQEIRLSRDEISRLTGRPCEHFSFPNGDYTEREIAMVKRAGYRSARTIDYGWNDVDTDPYRLRISGATDDASLNILAVQLSCISFWVRCLLSGSLTGETKKNVLGGRRGHA